MFFLDPYMVKVRSAISGDWLTISKSTADILDLKPGAAVDEAMARRIVNHEKALVAVACNFAKLNADRKDLVEARARAAAPRRRPIITFRPAKRKDVA